VDQNNKVNFYDGKVRVVDTGGKELYKYSPKDYLDYVEERVEPWTYLKFPYLKKIGWKGFVDGQDSGVLPCHSSFQAECSRWNGNPGRTAGI